MSRAIQLHLGMAFFETHVGFLLSVLLLTAFMESSLNLRAPMASACAGVQREEPGWELHSVAYGAFSAVFSLACNFYSLGCFSAALKTFQQCLL